jgi:hypothetical protein
MDAESQRKSARKKDQKNSSRRGAQIETADGRRKKICVNQQEINQR